VLPVNRLEKQRHARRLCCYSLRSVTWVIEIHFAELEMNLEWSSRDMGRDFCHVYTDWAHATALQAQRRNTSPACENLPVEPGAPVMMQAISVGKSDGFSAIVRTPASKTQFTMIAVPWRTDVASRHRVAARGQIWSRRQPASVR